MNYKNYCSSDRGFTLPMVMGLGLLMILAVIIMSIRSQGDRIDASNQKKTAQSLGVAETGIARVIALLKRYPALATKPTTNWNTTTDTTVITCSGGTPSTASNETTAEAALINSISSDSWIQVDSTDVLKGEYKVLSYSYNTGTRISTLTVQGRARSDNGAATTDPLNSTTVLEVQLPTSGNIPGIWVRNVLSTPIDVSTDESLNANVQVEGCSLPSDTNKINPNKLEKDQTAPGLIKPIKLIYDNSTPGVNPSPDAFPALPAPPMGTPVLPSIDASNCHVVLPRILRTNGNPTGTTCNSDSSLVTAFNGVTSDIPIGNVYSYIINSTSGGSPGGDSIKLSNSRLIIDPPAGTKVVLYVRGNITISGTGGTSTVSCAGTTQKITSYTNSGLPSNLEIYGANGSGGNWGTGYKMEQINVSDTTMMSAFIYAPEAKVDVSQGQIKGAVWAKEFKASNSSGCDIAAIQQDVGTLRVSLSPKIRSVSLWRRREAPSP